MSYQPGDIVKVTNNGTNDVTIGWDSKYHTIRASETKFVPAEAVINAFGDPRSSQSQRSVKTEGGESAVIPSRLQEVRRLRLLYGGGGVGDDSNFNFVDIPSVSVETLEGEKIPTVLDDPKGDTVNAATQTVSESNDLMAIISRQQKQIQLLLEQTGIDEKAHASEEELPTDESTLEGNLRVKNLLDDSKIVTED